MLNRSLKFFGITDYFYGEDALLRDIAKRPKRFTIEMSTL